MKPRMFFLVTVLAALVSNSPSAVGQTATTIAYQGRLMVAGGVEPSDRFDLRFRLFDAAAGGSQLDESFVQTVTPDTNGLFTVLVDAHPTWSSSRTVQWVELGARRSGGTSNYVTLSPRQRVSPVPAALHAQHADVANAFTGAVSVAQLPAGVARLDAPQTFTAPPTFMPASGPPFMLGLGTTSRVANLNADLLDGLDATNFWRWSFVDGVAAGVAPVDLPVEIRIQNTRVLRLERGVTVPNLIGGSSANTIAPAVFGSVIAGGGGSGGPHLIAGNGGFIGAGLNNRINANADHSVVAGGNGNQIAPGARESIIGGGANQRIGTNSINAGIFSGSANEVMANSRFAGVLLGANNKVRENSDFAAVLSGENQAIDPNDDHSVIAGGAANVIRSGAHSAFVGGGQQSLISTGAFLSVIGGGQANQIGNGAYRSVVAGGNNNQIGPASYNAFLGGGGDNRIEFNAPYSAILAGNLNVVRSNAGWATVLGGVESVAGAPFAIAGGHGAKANHSGSIVLADGQYANFASSNANEFAVRAAGGVRFVTAGAGLFVDGQRLTSGGGEPVIPDGSLTALKMADGAALAEILDDDGTGSGLDADRLDGLSSEDFWRLTGNAGTTAGGDFLGTTDNHALELKVNNARAFRLEPNANSPNVIGGYSGNGVRAGVQGVVISGGGTLFHPDLGGPWPNEVTDDLGNIGGGLGNRVEGAVSTVGGGFNNVVESAANYGVIAGGISNRIRFSTDANTIGGGGRNLIEMDTDGDTIAGGVSNQVGTNSDFVSIGGGYNNAISPNVTNAVIAGGFYNLIRNAATAATISGGEINSIGTNADYAVIAGGRFNRILTSGTSAAIGGGDGNEIGTNAYFSTIAGGIYNSIQNWAYSGVIAGGENNEIGTTSPRSTIGGGHFNAIQEAGGATIGGGTHNAIATNADYATVSGGSYGKAINYGQHAYANGRFMADGDAQTSTHVLRRSSSVTNLTELFLDGVGRRMNVPRDSAWTFDILIIAGSETDYAGYQIRGVIVNYTGLVVLLGSPVKTTLYESDATWDAIVEADIPNGALVIKAQGAAGQRVRWVASVRTVEVGL